MPAAPMVASSVPAAASGGGGRTSNQRRYSKYTAALTTRADNAALTGPGALACASGSHPCRGNMAALIKSPPVISAEAAVAEEGGSAPSSASCLTCIRSSVPAVAYTRATPSR